MKIAKATYERHQTFQTLLEELGVDGKTAAADASLMEHAVSPESYEAEVLCDMKRPLGTFLINFERDTDRDWNLYGLSPLRQALHSLSLIHILRPRRRFIIQYVNLRPFRVHRHGEKAPVAGAVTG